MTQSSGGGGPGGGDPFSSLMSGFGNMMQSMGGTVAAGGSNPFTSGGTDPNTGQPIPQTPQATQAETQGPPAGITPPGTDPATQIGGTQSRSLSLPEPLQHLFEPPKPIEGLPPPGDPSTLTPPWWGPFTPGRGPKTPIPRYIPNAPDVNAPDASTANYPDSTSYDPNQGSLPHTPQWGPAHAGGSPSGPIVSDRGGMPFPQNEPGETAPGGSYDPSAVTGYGPNYPTSVGPRLTDRNFDPTSLTSADLTKGGSLSKQYGDFLQGQGVGRPVASADKPAAGAAPMAGGDPQGGGYGGNQGQGGMPEILGNLMGMFLPMILGSLMGGRGGMGGMGALLPMMMMGGMLGQGGMGRFFGGRQMMPGMRGGFMRPGYYPDGRGGFGFHAGGWHPGWQPHYIHGYGGHGGGVTSAPGNGPWSNNPFLSTLVGKESGGRQGPGVRGDGGLAKGFFQFHDATWQRFARNVPGASQYASAEDAPPEIQQAVAMTAPISEWGPDTKRVLHDRFGRFDERLTIGQLSQMFGGGDGGGATTTANAPASTSSTPPANPLATTSPSNIRSPSEWQPAGG